jgi:hypothetical protein
VDNHLPVCVVLDGGESSYGKVVYLDSRDPRQISHVLGSPGCRFEQTYAGPPALYTVRFRVEGGRFIPDLVAAAVRARAERRQRELAPAVATAPWQEQWDNDRAFAAEGQRLMGLLSAARSKAGAAQQEAEKLVLAGVADREAALRLAAEADLEVVILERKMATRQRRPSDRQRVADEQRAAQQRALDEASAAERRAAQAEARRQLCAATYKGADGVELSMATLLENVAFADFMMG